MKKESVIHIMLKDEYKRTVSDIRCFEEKIKEFPKGSVKCVKNKYFYLVYRENGKIVNKYIGKEEQALEIKKKIEKRKYYERVLNKYKEEKKEIELYLKAGEKIYGKECSDN